MMQPGIVCRCLTRLDSRTTIWRNLMERGTAMPFVTCPDCGRESTAPRELLGLEWDCPKCGTAFIVRDDDAPVPLPRRKRRRTHNTGRWALLLVLLLATVAAAAWAGVRWSRPRVQHGDTSGVGPSTTPPSGPGLPLLDFSGDGPDWTYREMLDHLRSRGLKVNLGHYRSGQFFLLSGGDVDVHSASVHLDEHVRLPGVVTFEKTASAKVARESAGQYESGTFAWGRWVFFGNEATLDKFRMALGTR
ncbi:---NA--- : [Gemmataceae bacterium]|nr:---NA--- : [Gemmataceae bacterium]VTT98883.1 ---NA--- : [Gemmataceae bacterium]